ncbi:DAO-domain-containing protein [Dendrothele bispora CBS 962.96]|uniref:Glycerol-3-phosphate dehydrogenase n=1 Tax=Dendrothele bispora (strain CBS 962.96) TaxID=1314807 RepID=A0A4S8M1E6_DENBC|nr:DAO-domain-containing protein [Dendrothele bispora CBS 962.96]
MHRIRRVLTLRNIALTSGTTALVIGGGGYAYLNSGPVFEPSTVETRRPPPAWSPPSRAQQLSKLSASSSSSTTNADEAEFDLLIVGGGATGAGVALDAASRGLKVALVERDDFSAGTSSKSTKLVHGGVRYLQKAVFELDYEQWKLVKEALHERRIFLETAPYLSQMLPIMLPIYNWYQIPYYYAGCKLYDLLSASPNNKTQHTQSSYLMSRSRALETFPMLKQQGLVGAVVYYDGQHNDSRMNLALIMSAVREGAVVANYCEVTSLHKNSEGKLIGAKVKDGLTGKEFDVKAKGVVNATGPFSDSLLKLDNPEHKEIVQPSSGVHITLPNYYSPRKMGLLDPSTSDGRVIFFLPWQGATIAGTTDARAPVEKDPVAHEEEIRWVLEEVRRYLSPDIKVRRGDVLSAWSGLRPLVRNPAASSTEGLVRNHMIYVSPSGLLTIAGGKWTTYRRMAEETVDEAIKAFNLLPRASSSSSSSFSSVDKLKCHTDTLKLLGSSSWHPNMFISLIQRYGLETDVAQHLASDYGDRAWTVCEWVEKEPTGESWPVHGKRLVNGLPYLEAEIRYAVHNEYALKPTDILARRTRLSFLNVQSALECLPRVVDIMGEELGWSFTEKRKQLGETVKFLESMGLPEGVREQIELGGGTMTMGGGKMMKMEPGVDGLTQGMEKAVWGIVDGVKGVRRSLFGLVGLGTGVGGILGGGWGMTTTPNSMFSRAKFEAGEMGALKSAFAARASTSTSSVPTIPTPTSAGLVDGSGVAGQGGKIKVEDVVKVLKEVSGGYGYEDVKDKDVEYAIAMGDVVKGQGEVDWDEFVEICGNLKEISFAPDPSTRKQKRMAIPVEKSGGGV